MEKNVAMSVVRVKLFDTHHTHAVVKLQFSYILVVMKQDSQAYLKHFVSTDCVSQMFNIQFTSLTQKECLCEYQVSAQHFNPLGILHGGILYSVMDSCQGAFLHFVLDEAYQCAATGTATVKYLNPAKQGVIQVKTWLKQVEGRKYFVSSAASDLTGKPIASLEGLWIAFLKEK